MSIRSEEFRVLMPRSCVDCEHYSNEPDPRYSDPRYAVMVCAHPTVVYLDVFQKAVSSEDDPPPGWCPLKKK